MSTRLNRTAAKARLVTVFTSALSTASVTGVTVARAWPGLQAPNEVVFLGDVEGEVRTVAMTAAGSRKPREDRYTVQVWVMTRVPGKTAVQAETRVEDILEYLEDGLTDARLGNTVDGLYSAVVTELDGPQSAPRSTQDGYDAWAAFKVEIVSRHS